MKVMYDEDDYPLSTEGDKKTDMASVCQLPSFSNITNE